MQSQAYEITFIGQAGTTLRAELDDCEVTVRSGYDVPAPPRAPDQKPLSGSCSGCRPASASSWIDVQRIAPPPAP